MRRLVLIMASVVIAICASAGSVTAQQPPQPLTQSMQPRQPHPPDDPLADAMFPPELIMQHARELNLTQEQKTFMRNEIQKTTTRFNELQWQLQDAMEALHETMKSNSVNEQQALTQLDKVLDAEREIKRLHIGMGIRIKNQLTAEQLTRLQAMHSMMGPDGPGEKRGRGPDGQRGRGPGMGGPPPPFGPGGPGGPTPGGPGGAGRPPGRP